MGCGCGCGGEVVAYEDWDAQDVEAAEYKGRKVTLNKPFRTSGGPKKFGVYTKNEKGNVVLVRFGDPNMEIKRDDPQRRKNFRSRHNCDNPGPKWKARYWSCYQWRSGAKVEGSEEVEAGMEDYIFSTKEGAEKKSKEIGFDGATHMDRMADGTPMYFPGPDEETFQKWFDKNDSHSAEFKVCGGCKTPGACMQAEHCKKEMVKASKHEYDNPGDAMKQAKKMGCDKIHSHDKNGKTVFMPCGSHEEMMQKMGGKKVEGYYDDEEKNASYHTDGDCKEGYEKKDGMCVKVSVELDLEIEEAESILEATTGKTVIRIKGIAFHEGVNKNRWSLTRAGAENVVDNFVGTDLTLLHPKTNEVGSGFTRNMDGGVEEAIVGYVTSAYMDEDDDGWLVRFEADVVRTELFEALESGLWLRKGYGVSIGGTGKPEVVKSSEDGKNIMVFGTQFNIDHLAIVHKPAYPKARITEVERVKQTAGFIGSTSTSSGRQTVTIMTDDIEIEASDNSSLLAEMEDLKAQLILANATVDEFHAREAAAAEEERISLVEKATELGMKGHEELTTETLEGLIASWEASHPEPTPVEMKPVEASTDVEATEVPQANSGAVVANYLNGDKVETPEAIYEVAYNLWADQWNSHMKDDDMRALTFGELKDRRMI